MESLDSYRRAAEASGLMVVLERDISDEVKPTFAHWWRNAHCFRHEVVRLLGFQAWEDFVASCRVLEKLWELGKLGYAMVVAQK